MCFCFTYLPPEQSPFYQDKHNKGIELLEQSLLNYNIDIHDNLIIVGDLNSRTGDRSELLPPGNNQVFNELSDLMDDSHLNKRVSQDRHVNSFGVKLLDFCKTHMMRIANGRLFDDQSIGHFTYIGQTGCSVIDYLLCSDNMLHTVTYFNIECRTESCHAPIKFNIITKRNVSEENQNQTAKDKKEKYCFSESNVRTFRTEVDKLFSEETVTDLCQIINDQRQNISDTMELICNTLQTCGRSCLKKCKDQAISFLNPVWFNRQCQNLKFRKNQALRKFRRHRIQSNLDEYLTAKKCFKDLCTECRIKHDERELSDLINKTNDSKAFWNKLKFMTNNTKTKSSISIKQWKEHFEQLFESDGNHDIPENIEIEATDDITDDIFNGPLTYDEINRAIKSMKTGKSAGNDGLTAEFYRFSLPNILPILHGLFNRIFKDGIIPKQWCESLVVPIHKKGSFDIPGNYRGISLLNVLGKIYTKIICRRLTFYINIYGKISESQSGFREGYQTTDNAFVLQAVIQRQLAKKGGKLYIAYVDFMKAFDFVDRNKLFEILKQNGIYGNMYKSLAGMYRSVRARVKTDDGSLSEGFDCPVGLKQGCCVSSILFIMFIDEFVKSLEYSDYRGIQMFPDVTEVLALLFADDLSLLGDTVVGLQRLLNALSDFCQAYNLVVNIQKTKIMVYKNGGVLSRVEKWTYRGEPIETVSSFSYVGVLFTQQLSFPIMASEQATKAKRVLVALLSKLYKYGQLPRSAFFKIFDTKVLPILLYGAEIWSVTRQTAPETVHLYACKRYMCLPKRSTSAAVLGDCGRHPVYIAGIIRAIKYWLRLICLSDNRYVKKAYNMMFTLDQRGSSNWVTSVKTLLNNYGFGHIWLNQNVDNKAAFLSEFKQRLIDEYLQEWSASVRDSSKLSTYMSFKMEHKHEYYLGCVTIRKFRAALCRLRCSSHQLAIEQGRYRQTPVGLRLCPLCNNGIETELHFVLKCPAYIMLRERYILPKYYNNVSQHKFIMLMSSQSEYVLRNLAMFVFYAFKLREQLLNR